MISRGVSSSWGAAYSGQRPLQFLRFHRFRQVQLEACFQAALLIGIGPVAGEGDEMSTRRLRVGA